MEVSRVSSSNLALIATSPVDKEIYYLQKYKMRLQEQINKVKQSEMDMEMKQERIEGLTEQINEIDAQIRQKQMEKMKPDYKTASNKNDTYYEEDKNQDPVVDNAGDKAQTQTAGGNKPAASEDSYETANERLKKGVANQGRTIDIQI